MTTSVSSLRLPTNTQPRFVPLAEHALPAQQYNRYALVNRLSAVLCSAVIAVGYSIISMLPCHAQQPLFTYPPEVSLQAVSQFIEAAPKEHPRLFADAKTLSQLSEAVKSDPVRETLAAAVIKHAELLEDVSPIKRELQGRRLLGESRRCLDRVLTLATAYHLTGEPKFAARGAREMLAVAEFSDWNPSHFLDVGEMTLALAIGYDWLYHELDDQARQKIRTAIVEKSLRLPFETKHKGWVRATNNWGQVCHAGLTAGALAVMEDEPELAAKTVHNAVNNVTRSMHAIAPKGSYPEGPGYWAYGTTFNVVLIDILETVLGSDFALSDAPGFDQTGGYPAMVTGPSGLTFNYADGGSGRGPEPAISWFAARYDRPDWLRGEPERIAKFAESMSPSVAGRGRDRLLPLMLLWSDGRYDSENVQLPLHWSSEGEVPITIHRSSWDDAKRTFLGLKAGSPSAAHGHMDGGSFVLDADGVRWALDLGAESYHGIESRGMNLWSRDQNSDRWTIFRQSNHSHNTLVIDGQLQTAAGKVKVVDFSDDPRAPFTTLDLSDVYRDQAKSILRTAKLLPSGEVLMVDRLSGLKPGVTVRWAMVTYASADQKSAGESIRLTQKESQMTLSILQPTQSSWQVLDSEKPRNEWDSPNRGTQMVAFKSVAPDSGSLTLGVLFTPGSCQSTQRDQIEIR